MNWTRTSCKLASSSDLFSTFTSSLTSDQLRPRTFVQYSTGTRACEDAVADTDELVDEAGFEDELLCPKDGGSRGEVDCDEEGGLSSTDANSEGALGGSARAVAGIDGIDRLGDIP